MRSYAERPKKLTKVEADNEAALIRGEADSEARFLVEQARVEARQIFEDARAQASGDGFAALTWSPTDRHTPHRRRRAG